MEQLIELLKQIRELAGAGVEALEGASKEAGGKPEGKPEGGHPAGPPEEGGEKPPMPEGEKPPGEKPEEKPRY